MYIYFVSQGKSEDIESNNWSNFFHPTIQFYQSLKYFNIMEVLDIISLIHQNATRE